MTGKQLAFTLLTVVDGTGTNYTNPWIISQLFYLRGAIRENPRHYSTSTVLGSTISEACHARKCTSIDTFEPVDAALPATITARIKDRQMGESVTRVRMFLVTENEKDRDKSAKFQKEDRAAIYYLQQENDEAHQFIESLRKEKGRANIRII